MSVASSNPLMLNCTAIANTVNGNIAPNIMWMKDGALITNSSNMLIITTISDTVAQNVLTVLNFTAADSGVYVCLASVNNVNITSDPIELTSGECCVYTCILIVSSTCPLVTQVTIRWCCSRPALLLWIHQSISPLLLMLLGAMNTWCMTENSSHYLVKVNLTSRSLNSATFFKISRFLQRKIIFRVSLLSLVLVQLGRRMSLWTQLLSNTVSAA